MKDSPILLFNIKVNLLLRVFLSYLNFSIISGVLIEKFFISFKEVGSFDFLNIFITLSASAFEQNPDIFENLKAMHIPIATASPCIIFPSKFPNDSIACPNVWPRFNNALLPFSFSSFCIISALI